MNDPFAAAAPAAERLMSRAGAVTAHDPPEWPRWRADRRSKAVVMRPIRG
jgi:hypothetical protein